MNKKGVELTFNTVIIGIITVLVLFVVVTIFFGGTAKVTETVKSFFTQATAGTPLTIAVQTCQQRCDQAMSLPTQILKSESAFCTAKFELDRDGNGEADIDEKETAEKKRKIYIKYSCKELNVECGFDCTAPAATAQTAPSN